MTDLTLLEKPQTANTNQASIEPQRPQWSKHSYARLQELFDGGEVSRAELLKDLDIAKGYHTDPISSAYAIWCYRQITATHHMRGNSGPVATFVFDQFARDCEEEGLTAAQVDYGMAQWRRKKTSFAPTFGELLDLIRKGQLDTDGPGESFFRNFKGRIQTVVDPKVRPITAGKPPKETAKSLTDQYTESRDLLERMKSEKRAGGYYNGLQQWKDWSEVCEKMLVGVQGRVDSLEKKLGT
jgi:hypothetical protein